jgi:phosphoesterase RecJ-like protein
VSLERVVDLVRSGRRFLVTCHIRPDSDALGSALGLAAILRARGKEAVVYSDGGVPEAIGFLEGAGDVVAAVPEGTFDATFITDTAAAQLVPALPPPERRGPIVMVDHHAAHDAFGDVMLRDIEAAATAEVVLRLHDTLPAAPLPREAAQPLYAAIVADTGGFRYGQTRPGTLRLAARLLDLGVDPWDVASRLFERWAPARMALLGEVLRAMRLEHEGRVALVTVDRSMLDRTGASEDMIEGMVNYGRMLDGVLVAALLWEPRSKEGREVKLSLRAATGVDVAAVAVALGGGGHRSAAGATLTGSLDEAGVRVLAALAAALPPLFRAS